MFHNNDEKRIRRAILAVLLAILIIPSAAFAASDNELPPDELIGGTDITDSGNTNDANKKENPLTIKISKKTYKRSSLKKAKTFNIGATGKGKITYTRNAAAKKAGIKVSSKGKVTVPKKCKKGTYKITVKAAGNNSYQAGSKTIKIVVK